VEIKNYKYVFINMDDKITEVNNANGIIKIHLESGDMIQIADKKMKEIFDHLDPKDVGFKLSK